MSFLAGLLAKLAVGVLKTILARKDLKDSVRLDIKARSMELWNEASNWKADNPIDVHAPIGDDFGVHPGHSDARGGEGKDSAKAKSVPKDRRK